MGAYDQPDTLCATVHPASCLKFGRFLPKPDTQLRVSPFFRRDADAAPTDKDFSVRGNHPPRVKEQRLHGFRRKNEEMISYFTDHGQGGKCAIRGWVDCGQRQGDDGRARDERPQVPWPLSAP